MKENTIKVFFADQVSWKLKALNVFVAILNAINFPAFRSRKKIKFLLSIKIEVTEL